MEFDLVGLLRFGWIAGILPIIIASLPLNKLGSFHGVIIGFCKRGKILDSSSQYKFTVPQRFFTHFYVVAVAWTTFLLFTTWIYAYTTAPLASEPFLNPDISSYFAGRSNIFSFHKSRLIPIEHRYRVWLSVLLLLLMEVQAVRRLLESSYMFNYSPSARMHIFAYLTGLYFYTAAPLSLCCNIAPEVFEFGKNGVSQIIVKGKRAIDLNDLDWWNLVSPLLKLGWCQYIGVAIFVWGSIHQYRCHAILGLIRENGQKVDEYVIPHGDWFDIVSCPHYLAEIVLYAGMVVASRGTDLTIWLLFSFVVANLVLAAAETHRWYRRKFDNYPRTRYAVIPYIY